MFICPACNGILEYIEFCPKCGDKMKILDRIENYYDDYSPYLSYEMTDLNDENEKNICAHMSVCITCGYTEKVFIHNIVK